MEIESNNDNFALELASMCTDCDIMYEKENIEVKGEPTEVAIVKSDIKK